MPLEIYVINRLVKGGDITVPLCYLEENEFNNITIKNPDVIGIPTIYTIRKIDGNKDVIDYWPRRAN